MKRSLFILLLFPLLSSAQTARFENDTLHTSGGYKIYKGRVLDLGNGSSEAGYFRYIKFHTNMARNDTYTLQGGTILVKSLKQFKTASSGNHTIRISGTATRKGNSALEVDFFLSFDKAIYGEEGSAPELVVPQEFRKRPATVTAVPADQPVIDEPVKKAEEVKKETSLDELKKLLVADEIKKLFDLYKAGALTKEEYEKQKKKLLEQ
jgi:hypothetical protein